MRALRIFAPLALALMAAACAETPYRTDQGLVWGTSYTITYQSERDMTDSILQVMDRVSHSLSPFDTTSIVSHLNRGDSPRADAMLREVLGLSQRVCSISDGAFDPTLAPLINLWGFGYADTGGNPSQQQIDSALALVGIRQCSIDSAGYVRKPHPGTQFNFSAVAKGYGVDRIGQMLRRNGIVNYMVEVGGEIAVSGVNSRGQLWRIQIDAPVPGVAHQRQQVLELTDCGIATSGNYRNFRATADGQTWHTISAATGRPAITSIQSATVIAPTCAQADALATALMAMPDTAARALARSLDPPIQVILVP